MKTPDEIKKGLEVCGVLDGDCENCSYDDGRQLTCVDRSRRDALAYIIHLESRLAQVERERTAALHDLKLPDGDECAFCKHANLRDELCAKNGYDCVTCADKERCVCLCCTLGDNKWEWRGVCEENTKEIE